MFLFWDIPPFLIHSHSLVFLFSPFLFRLLVYYLSVLSFLSFIHCFSLISSYFSIHSVCLSIFFFSLSHHSIYCLFSLPLHYHSLAFLFIGSLLFPNLFPFTCLSPTLFLFSDSLIHSLSIGSSFSHLRSPQHTSLFISSSYSPIRFPSLVCLSFIRDLFPRPLS